MISVTWMRGRLAAGLFGLVISAFAAGHADAACYAPTQQLPAQVVSDFIDNPAALLQQYPAGGAQMISRIRDLAASNPTTLVAIMSMIATASKDQRTGIGAGLGQAARVCLASSQAADPANQQFGS